MNIGSINLNFKKCLYSQSSLVAEAKLNINFLNPEKQYHNSHFISHSNIAHDALKRSPLTENSKK